MLVLVAVVVMRCGGAVILARQISARDILGRRVKASFQICCADACL